LAREERVADAGITGRVVLRPMMPMSQLLTGAALAMVVAGALALVVALGPKGAAKKVEHSGAGIIAAPEDRPHFVVRAPGIGAAKARSQIDAVVAAHHGTIASSEGSVLVARVPRSELINVTQDLAKAGRYKMTNDAEIDPAAREIVFRFELE
jgi:hypothetical protein